MAIQRRNLIKLSVSSSACPQMINVVFMSRLGMDKLGDEVNAARYRMDLEEEAREKRRATLILFHFFIYEPKP